MIRSVVVSSVLVIAVAGCQAPSSDEAPASGGDEPAAAALAPGDTLTAEGIGPLRVGVYAASVWGGPRTPASVEATCEVVEFANGPPGVKAMVNSGMVAQVILEAPSTLKTDRGFGPGDDGAAVKAAYGASAIVAPAMSVPPPAEDITVWTDGEVNDGFRDDLALRGLRYSIGTDGKVSRVTAGGPAIQLENCG
jgi:hypothetical protein